jgi:hypothetical protein
MDIEWVSITPSGDNVVVTWPAMFPGFVLQEISDLTTTNWLDVTNAVSRVGEENQVVVPRKIENNFFRLRSR